MTKKFISLILSLCIYICGISSFSYASVNESIPYGEKTGDMMLFDFTTELGVKSANAGSIYSTEQKLSGTGSRKGKLSDWTKFSLDESKKDWSAYCENGYLQMTVYSPTVTGDLLQCSAVSENTNTSSRDEYHFNTAQYWSGWNVLTFKLSDASIWSAPRGWDQVDYFLLQFSPVTEIYYIDRIWLTNVPEPSMFNYDTITSDGNYMITPSSDYTVTKTVGSTELLKQKSHPRLILDKQGFDDLKSYINEVSYIQKAYANVKAEADKYLNTPVSTYMRRASDSGVVDRTSLNVLLPLAFVYKIEGNSAYKDRLWLEIEQLAKWQPMNLNDDLGVGDYARALALCYDWLYNDWTPGQRMIVRNILMRNFVQNSYSALISGTRVFGEIYNHNFVINSGLGMCALAFGDEFGYETVASHIIDASINSMWNNFATFGPDGASPEGVDYFEYGQDGVSLYLAAMLSSLGTDYGIQDIPGRDKLGEYMVAMNGSVQCFDYSDTYTELRTPSELLFLADVYEDKDLAAYVINNTASFERLDIRDMLYFKSWMKASDDDYNFSRDFNLKSTTQPVASVRSSYDNKNAFYLAFKGGAKSGHSELDYGSFVYDALGVRWFHDSGIDSYSLSGYFNYEPMAVSNRFNYYSKRAEGHNTIVINPGRETADQDISAECVNIEKFKSGENYAYGIMDLTSAYTESVTGANITSVNRGIALLNNRSTLVIRDEISADENIEMYSFLHTTADITIDEQTKKTAVLEKNGKKLKVTLAGDGILKAMEANSLTDKYKYTAATAPQSYAYSSKEGMKKLAVYVESDNNPETTLFIQPLYMDVNEVSLPLAQSLDDWGTYEDAEQSLIDGISVGGIAISDFRSGNTQYAVASDVREISASAKNGVELHITQATKESPIAYINARNGGLSVTYCVSFTGDNYTLSNITAPHKLTVGESICTVTVNNNGDTAIYPSLIAATYKNGELTGVEVSTKRINYNVYQSLKDTLITKINVADDDTKLKFFLWDTHNNPYSKFDCVEIK